MLNTVLVVDDNLSNLKLMEKQLKTQGYQVNSARNGAEALESARQNPPDVIVSDILMPVMDGFALCQKWRIDPKLKNIPFIFYTATYTDSRDEQLALSIGANRFIVKPAEPAVFLSTIQSVLEEFRQKQGNAAILPPQKEEVILTKYNEVLIHKLEQKVQELKDINSALETEVNQRKAVEKSLRQSQEMLQRVFSSIAGGIVITDLDGKITDCNANAVSIARLSSKNDLVGKSVFTYLTGAEKNNALETIRQTVRNGASFNHQYNVQTDDGSIVPVEVSSCTAKDESGNPLFVVISFSNITMRKEMEKRIVELYEQEKQQREELQKEANARGLFIEVLAHELRTPLTPILVSSSMLFEEVNALPEDIRKKLCSHIFTGTRVLVSRLEELLDLANYTRGTFKLNLVEIGVPGLVQEVVEEFKLTLDKQNQTVALEIAADLPEIRVDRTRLKLVMANLLSNACKYSPPESEIKISVSCLDQAIQVEVHDKGSKITETEKERLFKPYHQVEQDRQKFTGIGLGLAICKQIIEAHKGRLGVTSRLEEGNTFILTLPLMPG